MRNENQNYVASLHPLAQPGNVVQRGSCRFTVLTPRLLRMEYQEDGCFQDAPTLRVVCRDFPPVPFEVRETEDRLELRTQALVLTCRLGPFTPQSLQVRLLRPMSVSTPVWYWGNPIRDLKGTARTLDEADGAIPLESGLLSRGGFTVLDDSETPWLAPDGSLRPRTARGEDLYFFGYGHAYLDCLQDFYRLSGRVPRLPRYVLGNWWSRYYPYRQQQYLDLMDRFRQEEVPLAVSVIDMDWHLTQIPQDCGSGWTGYTWNRDLFPDPSAFLRELHRRGLRVTLNVHPAEGVGPHEEAYRAMAEELGLDPDSRAPIPFDASDPAFLEAYFRHLHHPLEEQGVDFWWLDWQQGTHSPVPGLDPLWVLNHAHFLDRGRDGRLPLTFSRFGGIGSHRYPIGFSGDTVTTWDSLQFQPYFTANASNVGYSWWSNDIGGHMLGTRDDELTARWVEFGCFSPILRLHSTCSEFYGKEPWNYGMEACAAMKRFLRLRHALIPYLHTMNYRTSEEGIPLMEPMYYRNDEPEAYEVPNQYRFGTSLIVCPITQPRDPHTLLAPFHGWLPEGDYADLFTGRFYRGGRRITFYRPLDQIPVLMPAGAILPLAEGTADTHLRNPEELTLHVVHGAEGTFTLVEDDGSDQQETPVQRTTFRYGIGEASVTFRMCAQIPEEPVTPRNRTWKLRIHGLSAPGEISVAGARLLASRYEAETCICALDLAGEDPAAFQVEIRLQNPALCRPDFRDAAFRLLQQAQISYPLKDRIWHQMEKGDPPARLLAALGEYKMEPSLLGALTEQIAGSL